MDKFLIRKLKHNESSSAGGNVNQPLPKLPSTSTNDKESEPSLKQRRIEVDLEELPADPGLRTSIFDSTISSHEKERIRWTYLQKGPCQPCMKKEDYPQTLFGDKYRRFNPAWFDIYPNWLEYSVSKDAVFCLFCYLFKSQNDKSGCDAFTAKGFRNWKHAITKLTAHVGGSNSSHNLAVEKGGNLLQQEQHIDNAISMCSDRARDQYAHMDGQNFVDADKLILRGLQFFGFHGVKTEEKKLGQKFLVDVDAWLDLHVAGQTDSMHDTVSYTDIYRCARKVPIKVLNIGRYRYVSRISYRILRYLLELTQRKTSIATQSNYQRKIYRAIKNTQELRGSTGPRRPSVRPRGEGDDFITLEKITRRYELSRTLELTSKTMEFYKIYLSIRLLSDMPSISDFLD